MPDWCVNRAAFDHRLPMIPALGIFALTYLLISKPRWAFAQLDRPTAGLIGAVLMIASGLLTPEQAYQAIDWDTIVLLLGMFVLSGSLRLAGFFGWAAAGGAGPCAHPDRT